MYFHCTENAVKEINHNLSQSNKWEQKNVYVWIVEYEKGDGRHEIKKGTVTLVR